MEPSSENYLGFQLYFYRDKFLWVILLKYPLEPNFKYYDNFTYCIGACSIVRRASTATSLARNCHNLVGTWNNVTSTWLLRIGSNLLNACYWSYSSFVNIYRISHVLWIIRHQLANICIVSKMLPMIDWSPSSSDRIWRNWMLNKACRNDTLSERDV